MQLSMRPSSLLRGGGIAVAAAFALSTQFLFQLELYDTWPLPGVLRGWFDYFADVLTVVGFVFAGIGLVASVRQAPGAGRHAAFLAAIALGALAGEAALLAQAPLPPDVAVAGVLLAKVARWLVLGGLGYAVYNLARRSALAASQAHESELQRIQLERQTTEAHLQSLRAQIEPHFLFNTLANVHRLYRTDPQLGRTMLVDYIGYLRAALPQMRSDETTLGQELELARCYLKVLQVRMGDRLRFQLDVPGDLASLRFPPLALSTLTENAVKHGLNPLPEGGMIEIAARLEGRRLTVRVADTGAGIRQAGGSGVGLANLRARLAAQYGGAASLSIEANLPRGIRATIAVPVRNE